MLLTRLALQHVAWLYVTHTALDVTSAALCEAQLSEAKSLWACQGSMLCSMLCSMLSHVPARYAGHALSDLALHRMSSPFLPLCHQAAGKEILWSHHDRVISGLPCHYAGTDYCQ